MSKPPQPADIAHRRRFVSELDRNFSVIAPAGVGKTRAIVDRVVAIATGDPDRARAWLPKLVVVTYTNKAADEMYQRARNAIIEKRVGLPILTQFNHAFFGTIHSFCVRLIRTHGHLCGLPMQFEAVEDDEELWQEFVRQADALAPDLPEALVDGVTRLMPMDDLLKLAREVGRAPPADLGAFEPEAPRVDLKGLLDQTGKGKSAATIERSQRAAQEWLNAWEHGGGFAPLPAPSTTARDFVASWGRTFGPIREWLGRAAHRVAVDIAAAYRSYRRARGALTYEDQIELAWELLRDPVAGRRLRAQQYRVILDEAQDTDPMQFSILVELARPQGASKDWIESGGPPPEPGRFCMVGDPQQSIYGQRADLGWYARIRNRFRESRGAEELVFSVTFRCDEAIIETVNELVAPMFERTDGQVEYHELMARPDVGPGQVVRWSPSPIEGATGVNATSLHEARELGRWMAHAGPAGLGARGWSNVAVLCPRIRWLQAMAIGLREVGLAVQLHSDRSVQADSPAYAWFTALMTVMAKPDDGFEIVGVLREIYGLSDEALALYAQGDGAVWHLREAQDTRSDVGRVLSTLVALRAEIAGLPLRDAARRAVEGTALRDRLRALPGAALDVDDAVDALLVEAAAAEDADVSLRAFADALRDGMEALTPAKPVLQDAVQLVTCHKAKGLQWDVVILPLCFRPIGEPRNYPALIRSQHGEAPHVALSSGDLQPMQARVDLKREQELQRLLYVALTRARQTLVLVDDDRLFARARPNHSFADLLGLIDNEGHTAFNESWHGLDDALRKPAREAAARGARAPRPKRKTIASAEAHAAAERAAEATRRILPYALGEAEARAEMAIGAPEQERTAGAEAARAYGIWWHETVEQLDWRASSAAMRTAWEDALEQCPDPERGRNEGKRLLASDFAKRLAANHLVVRREVPILWRRSEAECVEGIIDLAAWDPRAKRWLVADWKTNLVAADEVQHLRKIYEPQLRAYAEAIRAITRSPVEAGVYSTSTGAWVPCADL